MLSPQYTAGWIDGEGSLTYDRKTRSRVTATSTDHSVLVAMQETWGGWIYDKKHGNPNWAPAWNWNLNGSGAVKLVEAILPYLVTKRQHAEVWLELAKSSSEDQLHRGRPKGWQPGQSYVCSCDNCLRIISERERLVGELRRLNVRGSSPRDTASVG